MSQVVNRRLQIIIDETGAEQALERLNKTANKLTKTIEEGEKAGRDMTKELTKLESVKGKAADLEKVMTGKVAPSFRMVSNTVSKLRNELALMSKDAPGYADKFKKFQEVSQTFDIMRGKVNGFRSAAKSVFQEIKTVALGVTVGNTITAITQSITGFISQAVTGAAKLSDEIADIEKATGLTTAEVEQLNSQLGKLNTRTATSELRQIAIALGQAGEVANAANVQALDRINVALGDEFGGDTREIGNVLSVLRNNLQDIKSADYATDVTAIGNALNELGANGLATAPVVTDIANRIAGVAQTFGVTSGEILGTAASFQELGINVERGSTAYIKLLQKMAGNTETFAQVAGISVGEFERLLNEDINEALLRVAEGTKTAASNNKEFADVLASLETEGAGASELLSKLAANGDLVRSKIDLATKSLQSNSSILDEFNKKNNTLAAELDKLGKNIAKAFSSSTLTAALKGLAQGLNNVLTPAKTAVDLFKEQQATIVKLEKDLPPLLKRYDELKAKTSLSKEEQVELNKTIQAIGATIPTAITQFDQYGRAIDINRQKAADFINTQRLILKERNRDAIAEQKQLLKELEFEVQSQQRVLNAGKKTVYSTGSTTGVGTERTVELTGAEIQARQAQLQSLQQRIQGVKGIIDELTGKALQVPPPISADETKKSEDALKKLDDTFNKVISDKNTKSTEERERRKRELEALAKELQGIEQEIYLNTLEPYERKLQQLANKYSELFAKVGQDISKRDQALRLLLTEAQVLNAEFQKLTEDELLVPPPSALPSVEAGGPSLDLDNRNREKLAALELAFIFSNNKKKLDAQQAYLDEQQNQEEQALKLQRIQQTGSVEGIEAQLELIRQKYRDKRQDAEQSLNEELIGGIVDQLQNYLNQFGAISDAIGQIEQNRIQKIENDYNKEKKALDNLLEAKLISQSEYNRRVTLSEEKLAKEKARIAQREFRRNQALQIGQALINGYMAITSTLAARPGATDIATFGVLRGIQVGLVAALTAAQVAAIATAKAPQFAKGGLLPQGPSHAEGGIDVVSRGRKIAEIEGGEPIISKRVYRANKYLVDSLLAKGQTGDFSPLLPKWYGESSSSINIPRIQRSMSFLPKYATGGFLPQGQNENRTAERQEALLEILIARLNQPIMANVVYGEYETKAQTIQNIRYAGTIS